MRALIPAVLAFTTPALACSIAEPISNVRMVKLADAIVRSTASEYAFPPANPNIWTTGVPDSRVRFKIAETIRGSPPAELTLPGYLVDRDDSNDQASPCNFVRPGGRAGSCFVNSHRSGAQFLLFLKKTGSGEFTVNWYALGPVNEQLHSANDPWLLWARGRAPQDSTKPN